MGVASSICSEAGRLDFSANKSNRPASEQILLQMPMEAADDECMCGAKQKYLVDKNQAAYYRLGAHVLL